MKETKPEALHENVFDLIGRQWMLISASAEGKTNTMTASWGGFGILWNKKVATIYVRPQRYTRTFIDAQDYVSLSFFDESWRPQLSYLGTVSGRDEPKIEKAGLHLCGNEKAPCFREARLTIIARKLYAQQMEANCFLDDTICPAHYPNHDLHIQYVVEIEKILTAE